MMLIIMLLKDVLFQYSENSAYVLCALKGGSNRRDHFVLEVKSKGAVILMYWNESPNQLYVDRVLLRMRM